MVNTRFWDDEYIMELDPIEKLMFLYLLTNPLTDICGAYQITLKRIAFDTGIDKEMILKIFGRFATAGKIVYRDGWVFICNFAKHQSNNPKVELGIARSLSHCPDWIKIAYDSLSKGVAPNFNLNSNFNPNSDLTEKKPPKAERPKPEPKIFLPNDFSITEEMSKWAAAEVPNVDIDRELAEFKTFWCDIATKNNKRTMNGWRATWQNRMREVSQRAPAYARNQNGTSQKLSERDKSAQRTINAERMANAIATGDEAALRDILGGDGQDHSSGYLPS